MESQETSVLQATFVPKAAPDPLHALQVSYRCGVGGYQQGKGVLWALEKRKV